MPARAATAKRRPAAASPPAERLWVWAVCGFLLRRSALIYGQTLGHAFLNYDDNGFVFDNPHVTRRPDRRGHLLGASPTGPMASGIRWPRSRTCSIASSSA